MCERQFALLEGLCHCGELLREAMREATFSMFHRFTRVDLETFLGLVFGCLGVWVFGLVVCCLFLPRFRDLLVVLRS